MKMILKKHTSKFVAGLFNSLGITACVSWPIQECVVKIRDGKLFVDGVENTSDFCKSVCFFRMRMVYYMRIIGYL